MIIEIGFRSASPLRVYIMLPRRTITFYLIAIIQNYDGELAENHRNTTAGVLHRINGCAIIRVRGFSSSSFGIPS